MQADLWYCDPRSLPRRCHAVPCHGHRATQELRLVARVVGWHEGVDWDQVYLTEYRDRLRRAWQLLQRIRAGDKPIRITRADD